MRQEEEDFNVANATPHTSLAHVVEESEGGSGGDAECKVTSQRFTRSPKSELIKELKAVTAKGFSK